MRILKSDGAVRAVRRYQVARAAVKQKYEKDEKSGKWKEKNYRLYEAVV
jgi:cation transport regulator ChaB